jgi:aminomuconate-semialdehyde/2-hydroxymuconate-6-semialdehyde dehydrogenase
MKEILNFIGGRKVTSRSGKFIDVFEPATGLAWAKVTASNSQDVELAIRAAKDAFQDWSTRKPGERAKVLRKIATEIDRRKDELAQLESLDSGKPVTVARTLDIPRSAMNFEFFADAATQFSSDSQMSDAQTLNYTTLSPLGIVACISPWNLPLYLFSWKIAPALAAGNCVIAKPSEITPATADCLADIAKEAGLPPGVLNIVHGLGADLGEALCTHPEIKAISFTGSTKTGETISKLAAPLFKKLSLEMGGKNPTLIFADCDWELAVSETLRSAFSNQGQICLCGSRILVERSIYERFRDELVARARKLIPGDPSLAPTEQGAVVSEPHFKKILDHLETAKAEGGKILCGGQPRKVPGRCEKGWFVEPTLIENLGPETRTNQEEIFGPVATLQPFDSENDVLRLANATRYGLAASVFTRDLNRAHRVGGKLASGIVWVNCWMIRDLRTPFGGVKDSGLGREGGFFAMRFFTEPKNICIRIGEAESL